MFWDNWQLLLHCNVQQEEVPKELPLVDELPGCFRLVVYFTGRPPLQHTPIGKHKMEDIQKL